MIHEIADVVLRQPGSRIACDNSDVSAILLLPLATADVRMRFRFSLVGNKERLCIV